MRSKHSKNKIEIKESKQLPSSSIPDPSKSPFFIKQVEKARERLKKHPVPLELLKAK